MLITTLRLLRFKTASRSSATKASNSSQTGVRSWTNWSRPRRLPWSKAKKTKKCWTPRWKSWIN